MSAALLLILGATVGAPIGYALRALLARSAAPELATLRERLVELEVLLVLLRPAVDTLHRLSQGQPPRPSSGTGNFPAVRDT